MKYTLMHKDIPVVELVLDEATGSVQKIGELYHADHLPVGISERKGIVDRSTLNDWWRDRSIPASRSGVRRALETLQVPNTQLLLTKCFGLSLSDQYWVRPHDRDIQWTHVNFFTNTFSEDIGDVLLGKATKAEGFDFHSPDNTSDGFLKKRWKIINGKRCLLKAGSSPFMQQPFNEEIATAVAKCLSIPHVAYWVTWDDETPYSLCEDFITQDTELVSAWRVMQTQKRDNSTSIYQHYLNCCKALGVPVDMVHHLDQMIVLDYLIANEDRHQNNFGLVRNAVTLEWISPAPIFDSGSSLGYDKLPNQILSGKNIECKPFKKTHEEQLNLVSSFDWIDFKQLNGIEDEIRSILDKASEYLDQTRKDAICVSVKRRVEHLMELAMTHHTVIDHREDDIETDFAADYTPKMEF